jgi:hypothetical protein
MSHIGRNDHTLTLMLWSVEYNYGLLMLIFHQNYSEFQLDCMFQHGML